MKPGLYAANVDGTGRRVAWVKGNHIDIDSGLTYTPDRGVTDVRPLVVLDPEEDGGRVTAVIEGLRATESLYVRGAESLYVSAADVAEQILRALADPKPAEPTGLGAVVRLRDGTLATRSDYITTNPWRDGRGVPHEWRDLDVTEVLSGGWSE
jgi:hypothetical protein